MKMFYLNDEQKDIRVRIMDTRYDPATGTGDLFFTLRPAEGRVFDVQCPDCHSLYVKKWKDLVMISHIESAVLAQLEHLQQRHEDALVGPA
jgi:RNA polymerase subunit RPABC4/transcription elongation factor Spt4